MEFSALLNKMLIFIALMVIGYVLSRRGIFGESFTRTASSLVVNVFMVGTILSSMISTGAEHDLQDLAEILFLTFVMTAFGYVISALAVRGLFSSLSGATMPMSMMVIGASLGSVSLLDAFRKPILAFTSAVRLLIIPALTFLVCRPLTEDTALLMTNLIIAGSPSAVLCSILAIQYGYDGVFSSEGVQHSTVCSMVTLPLLIQVFSRLI